jgi:hypothetical protein
MCWILLYIYIKTHVLPEELLSLCLVELKQRVANKLFGNKDKKDYYEARCMYMVAPCCWADSERTAAVTAAALINVDMVLISSGLASLSGALSDNNCIATYNLASNDAASSSVLKNVKISEHIRNSMVLPLVDKVDEEEDDEEEGTSGALVFVITAGMDSLEASLVCLRGEKEDKKEKEDMQKNKKEKEEGDDEGSLRKLGWVSSMKVACGRGEAHVNAGLEDVVASLESAARTGEAKVKKSLNDMAASLLRSANIYGSNNVIATVNKANADMLDDAIQPNMDTLFKCMDQCLNSKRSKAMLAKYNNKVSCCLLRGAFFAATGNLSIDKVSEYLTARAPFKHQDSRLFVLTQECAVIGASMIAASEKEMPKSPFHHDLIASDSLQLAVGLVNYISAMNKKEKKFDWLEGETDILFERDMNLPFTCSRLIDTKFIKSVGGGNGVLGRNEVHFTICEQVLAKNDSESPYHFKRFQPIGDPLTRKNPSKHDEKEKGVSVVLKFYLDDSGLVTLRREAFLSEKEDDLIQHEQKSFFMRYLSRIVMAIIVIITLSGFGYNTYQQYNESSKIEFGRHAARVEALTEFYREHNPERMDTIEKALEEHRGKESVLWKKLEKKYGVSPPRPDYLKYRRSEF